MGEVQTTLRLNDQASSVLQKVAQNAQKAATAMEQTGKSMDKAFEAKSTSKLANNTGKSFGKVGKQAENMGEKINEALDIKDASSVGKKVETGLKAAETSANSLKSSAATAGEAVAEVGTAAANLGNNVGKVGDGSEGLKKVSTNAKSVGDTLKKTGEEVENVNDKVKGVGEGVEGSGEGFSKVNNQAVNLLGTLKTLAATVGAFKLASDLKSFVTDSINLGTQYTAQMSEVAAISGATGDDYKMLEETARQYGATTIFSASQAAEALKYMSLAGWDANQSSSALGGVLNLAAAAGMDLGQASDMVTDYLSAFGMQANQSAYFADMLSYAQSNSNTTAAQLGEAYLNSAANLHSAGQDVETTTSLLEAMANQGTKGSRAGTQLAAIARDITNGMKDGQIAIGKTSVKVKDANGNFRDFTDILTDVEKATNGMGSAERAAALATTFTADSTKGINQIMTEGMDKISGYEEALRNSGGAAEKAAGIMNDNLQGDKANLNSAFEEMQLQVFEGMEGTLREGTQYLTNEIIPTLTEWVPEATQKAAEGIGNLAKAVSPMIETILKNPDKIATAFGAIGAGLATFGGINKVSGIASGLKTISSTIGAARKAGNVADALGKLTKGENALSGVAGGIAKIGAAIAGNPMAAGFAAAAAGVTALVIALKKYNDVKLKNNLDEHFGSVELTDDQVSEYADRIINAKWKVNAEASLNHVENATELTQQAEEALSSNDTLEWKARIGLKLSDAEIDTYETNIGTFTQNIQQALNEQTEGIQLSLDLSNTDFRLTNGDSFDLKIEKWASGDMKSMSKLSSKLSKTVSKALKDGIIDADEQEAIDALELKMSNILSSWQQSKDQAKLDILDQKYGKMSGKDLTEGSFTKIVDELKKQREESAKTLEETNQNLYAAVEGQYKRGKISAADRDSLKTQIAAASRNSEAESLANSLNFETNTINDAYKKKLSDLGPKIENTTKGAIDQANKYLASGDYSSISETISNGFTNSSNWSQVLSDADQKNINSIWQKMKPDAQSMAETIDAYTEAGQEVPTAVMKSFNQAMEVGAAAGDTDAIWQQYANQIAQSGNEELLKAIDEGTVNVPDKLKEALERATAKTGKGITFDDVQAEIKGLKVKDIDSGKLDDVLKQKIDGLSKGKAVELDGGEVGVKYKVKTEMTAGDLAENLGMKVKELTENNPGLKEDTVLKVGTKVVMDESGVTVDTSGVGKAAEKATKQAEETAKQSGGDTVKVTKKVDTTYEQGTVTDNTSKTGDAAQAKESTGEAVEKVVPVNTVYQPLSMDMSQLATATQNLPAQAAVNTTAPANVTLTAGNVDASQVASQAQAAAATALSSGLTANGTVNANLSKGSDNIPAVYSQVGGAVNSAFGKGYNASASVNVRLTANYSLANPSKTITFGGGATGSATVTAHMATGGMVDAAQIALIGEDGPEYVIPVGSKRRGRGLDLWAQAGRSLGVPGFADGVYAADTGNYYPDAFSEPLGGAQETTAPLPDTGGMQGFSSQPMINSPMMSGSGDTGSVSTSGGGSSKDINLNINGSGSMKVNSNMSKQDVVDIIIENVKDVLMNIVEQEIMEEGNGVYEY